jgi:membrane-bound lytic murein transglycosylase B
MCRCLVACLAALLLLTPAGAAAQLPPPVAPLATPPPPFEIWLAALRAEAMTKGIRTEIIDAALSGIEEPLPQILERDRTQAEFTLDLGSYLKRRLTRDTARTAQRMYSTNRALLKRVGARYGVKPQVIVAVWGLESNFGRFAGVRPTIPALVTLAYDPRRSDMFRQELFAALEIVNRGDIELDKLKGSWAGALGQPQFMPSKYLEYAQDFDGDGRRDIWTSLPDVFASIAYYLNQHGWESGAQWGREVKIPKRLTEEARAIPRRTSGCRAEQQTTDPRSLKEWRGFGVRTLGGAPLSAAATQASLVQAGSRSFLVYSNYDALLAYNCAHSYALSVGLLADRLK